MTSRRLKHIAVFMFQEDVQAWSREQLTRFINSTAAGLALSNSPTARRRARQLQRVLNGNVIVHDPGDTEH